MGEMNWVAISPKNYNITSMTTNALDKLFGSANRVKIMRLFLQNQEVLFGVEEISRRTKTPVPACKKEIAVLKGADFIRQKEESVDEIIKLKNGKMKNAKKKVSGLKVNPFFSFLRQLKALLVDAAPIDRQKMSKDLSSAGQVKLVVFSGAFIGDNDIVGGDGVELVRIKRVDLLLVGDSLKKDKIDRIVKEAETLMGKELVYAVFSATEFWQRFDMHDRFIRDILDYPHEKAVNKLGIA